MTRPITARSSLPQYIDDAPVASPPITMSDISHSTYDPDMSPPEFGRAMHKFFGFDEKYVNVNHGGSTRVPYEEIACNLLVVKQDRTARCLCLCWQNATN